MLTLYDYFRSSASYRVRIALNYKQLNYQKIPVHLVRAGGEQYKKNYQRLNPQMLVPTLQDDDIILSQSIAIIEYLETKHPHPSLLPEDIFAKAKVRQLAQMVSCDIHPLNNLRVLKYVSTQFNVDEKGVRQWYHHWLKLGFDAIESVLQHIDRERDVCYGNEISLADVCLIPQVYNAIRFEFPLQAYPLIRKINTYCNQLPCFIDARPVTSET